MIDKQTIITFYRVNKLSRRAIARQLHLNRRTITKVITEYETALQEEDPDGSLEALLSKPPVYDVGTRKKRVLIPEVIELVHKCMKENERKRSSGLKKQCMLKKDVYDLVVSRGYKVSYQSICRYMYSLEKDKKESGKEAFIRQYYNPGEVCEFDWGEVKLHYQGKLQRFFLAVFTLAHSNGRFACLFPIKTHWPSWRPTGTSSVGREAFPGCWFMTICVWLSRSFVEVRKVRRMPCCGFLLFTVSIFVSAISVPVGKKVMWSAA